jgi:hypothetical protein
MVSDPFLHLLKPFAYLFNIYWSEQQPVIVAGYTAPQFRFPSNFSWHRIDTFPYPKDMYSEDYFLTRTVDHRGVEALAEYCRGHRGVLRCDLTTDRLYNGKMEDNHESWGCYDIIESPYKSEYQMSFQAGIWNRDLLMRLIAPGKTPWEMEIHTQPPENMRVIGTRQNPVRYANIMLKGEVQDNEMDKIPEVHRRKVIELLK